LDKLTFAPLSTILPLWLYEYYISAQKEKAQENPWFSETRQIEGWQECPGAPAKKRKKKAYGMTREDGLLLKIENGAQAARPQIKIVVSKKVAKRAVERNRIRRVLRDAAKKELGSAEQGRDFVLIALPGLDLKGARETVRHLFLKASRQ